MASELLDIVTDVRRYLELLRDEGARSVEVSPDTLDALGRVPLPAPPTGPAAVPPSGPATTDPVRLLEEIAAETRACTLCSLHETRTHAVPGQGSTSPDILFVGEAPGYDEDQQGVAFVGRAGHLLTRMIAAMGYTREEVFIGNILKCRPPNNRTPLPDEMATCIPYLKRQIAVLKPKVIVAMGATAVKGLLQTSQGITRLRGTWLSFEGIDLMPTFHPAYLLRTPSAKRDTWADLKAVLKRLGRPVPEVKKG